MGVRASLINFKNNDGIMKYFKYTSWLLIEKILFQDHQIPEEEVNPRDFFFYGLKL